MSVLTAIITSEGLQVSNSNPPLKSGHKISINKIEIVSHGVVKSRFPCTGILRGSNSITVNALVTGTETYDITQINLIDGISGKVFANVKRKDDAVIDTVNNGKLGVYVNIPVRFGSLSDNVVTIEQDGDSNLTRHINSNDAHSFALRRKVKKEYGVRNLNDESNIDFLDASLGVELKKMVESLESKLKPTIKNYQAEIFNNINVSGKVINFSDGYKVQIFELTDVRIIDLGEQFHHGRNIHLNLWERFGRKILNAHVSISNNTDNNSIPWKGYVSHEADEWQFIWRFDKARSVLDAVDIFVSRYLGSVDENVNVKIVVEGI